MPEFNPLQNQIQQIRSQAESERKNVFHSKERLKKIELRKRNIKRSKGEDSNEFQALLNEERELKQTISREESQLAGTLKEKATLFEEFQPFTDPRENMGKLSDEYPLLLFPVRLETRFKIVDEETGEPRHQLWVRIFPDECSVDTFDDTLSESEMEQIKNYWISIWKAGTAGNDGIRSYVRDKEIGAWKKLMGIFNSGRSYWLTQNFEPLNGDDIPLRNNESDIFLIIPAEELPDPALQDALEQYWSAVLLAQGDVGAVEKAFENLIDTLGISEDAARQLTGQYKPQNIDLEEPEPGTTSDVTVTFLHFPKSEDTDTKLTDWSQAATVTTFPEKFVLLGFRDDDPEPVINESGQSVPDPLIVGPDTRDDITELLREVYGEEFDELSDDEKAVRYVEYLSGQAETKWLFNFDEAVDMGLGFKVSLTEEQYNQGFDRLFVLGVKIAADEQLGKTELEKLIHNHHFGDSGFSILPQGTPTNNTEDEGSGYAEAEDPEEAYDRYFSETTEDDPHERTEKRDGRWLAELLGIDIDIANEGNEDYSLKLIENYFQTDQSEASAMNTALWNATIGYFMESMITPVSSEWERNLTRWFLINYVSGRGRMPSVRIGDQPYGILPVSTMKDLQWLSQRQTSFARAYSDRIPVLEKIYSVAQKVREDWEGLLDQVAYVGKEGDAHQILLQALGLHATSAEYDRRIAESFAHAVNKLRMQGHLNTDADLMAAFYKMFGLSLLSQLGYDHDEKEDPKIPILEKFFFTAQEDVDKPLIDDNPLSEKDPIRAYTDTGQNYIEWLIENARDDHRNIREQNGFTDDKAPDALLYEMLRHALNLEFGNTGLNLFQNAGILTTEETAFTRIDADFIDVESGQPELQSKWDLIYRQESSITDDLIVDHISELLRTNSVTLQSRQLHEVIAALERLQDVPTARLERCFAEHLDCCSYRLDAWLLGFLHLQLQAMRFGGESNDEDVKQGIYLGAYGFVENLRPEDKTLAPAGLDDELRDIFDPEDKNDIMKDNTNAGYIHAPSINHGLTAAVLRNAYISNASEEEQEIFKVNLSSERVRMALGIIEGMQQGQSLGALLGYQLERGLHDNNDEELDVYIYELRKVFSLVSNRNKKTGIEEGNEDFEGEKAITKIEARNVVDGYSLVKRIRETGIETYPFGYPIGDGAEKLKEAATEDIQTAIDNEVQRILNIEDAVADLAMAESVHQVVQGNYDRAAGALDAYSKGEYPQLPDVVQSPGSGVSLTHRFGIHLPSGIAPSSGTNPRDKAEPAVNAWLEDIFPPLSDIRCVVTYQIPDYEDDGVAAATVEEEISMDELGLIPIDLLYMLSVESEKNLTALDEYILDHIHQNFTPRPDAFIEINYTQPIENRVTFFEMASMISDLRTLIVSSRPLLSTDISLQNEAREEQNRSASIDPARITLVKQSLEEILDDLKVDFIDVLNPLIDDENLEATMANKTQIFNQFDTLSDHFITYLSQLSRFGISGAGFGHMYDRKRAIYSSVYEKVLEYKRRWDNKLTEYDDLIDQLPAAPTDEEKIEIWLKAERVISTQYTANVSSLSDLQDDMEDKKDNFDTKHTALESFLSTSHLTMSDLFNALGGLKTGLNLMDHIPLEAEEDEKQVVILAEDMLKQANKLYAAMAEGDNSKLTQVQNLLDQAADTAVSKEKIQALTEAAKLIFGEDFVMVPEFLLGAEQGDELQNCLGDRDQLLDYQLNGQSNDFPVDNWLYGVARVREKLTAWESLVMTAEGIKDRTPLDLTPVQLPYTEKDSWLGLSYPPDLEIESDKLLYTAYMPDFDPGQPQCGLLVDEWTEVVPAKNETSGMTFHFDRPNNEPPQTMLMVMPSAFTGQWTWDEVVESLHETLDLAKLRAIEPDQVDQTGYARFLPATVATMTVHPVTMFLNYGIKANLEMEDDG